MEELSPATGWMKRTVIGLVVLVVLVGITVALLGSQTPSEGEYQTETEEVSPVDRDSEANPF